MSTETSAGVRYETQLKMLPRRMMNNRVLVRIDFNPAEDVVRDSGIVLPGYAGTNWNEAAHMARYGKVVMTPDRLMFMNSENYMSEHMMEWGTELDVEVGDTVYFGASISATAESFSYDGHLYFAIPYSRLILSIRNDEIIMLNGFCLLDEVFEKVRADGLELKQHDKVDRKRGVIVKNGKNNTYYYMEDAVDAEVDVGDEVLFSNNFYGYLEDDLFNKLKKGTGYAQKRWIIAKLN